MRICCLGDLHYHGLKKKLENIVENVRKECSNVDVVVVAGDITGNGGLGFAFDVHTEIRNVIDVPVLVVPGNHDIYLSHSEKAMNMNSLLKLSTFNDLVERTGCYALMKHPFILGKVGFVGTIGWYDYSFAPDYLGLSIDNFREKYFGMYSWADKDFVELPFSDEGFTLMLLNKFEKQIREIYDKVEKIVVIMHHLPFRELVHYKLVPSWDYFSTFMGSEAFGYVIKKYRDKVRLVLHGHQHGEEIETGVCREVDRVKCCNCASTNPIVIEV